MIPIARWHFVHASSRKILKSAEYSVAATTSWPLVLVSFCRWRVVVRGRWRPTRRNIVPIVDSLSVVHPAPFSTTLGSPHTPFRHLIYLLFLNTFVEQFVIARCRLGTCAKQTGWERISSGNEGRERMMRKIRGVERGRKEEGGKEERKEWRMYWYRPSRLPSCSN